MTSRTLTAPGVFGGPRTVIRNGELNEKNLNDILAAVYLRLEKAEVPLADAALDARGAVPATGSLARLARSPVLQVLTSNTDRISRGGGRVHLSGTSDYKLTSTPSLVAGVTIGEEIQLVNAGAKLITIQGSALAGSTIKLRSRTVTLAPACSVTVVWNGTSWLEVNRSTRGTPNEHHVGDFGAIGDNSTDDTAAIQAAIDAAILDGLPVVLEPGVFYKTSAELLVNAGTVRIHGAGKFSGGIRSTVAARSVLAVTSGTLHVSDLQVYAERAVSVGIYIDTSSASVVERCHIYQPIVDGIQITNSDSCRILDVKVELAGKAFVTANYAGNLPANVKVAATGTVAVTGGIGAVITGTGTHFLSMGIRTGDFVAVHATGAGTSTSEYLNVGTVDSDTQITCYNESGPVYAAGSDFAVFVGDGYHEGPSRADNNNHLVEGWHSVNIAGSGIHINGLYGPRVANAQCDASGAYPVSVASSGVVTIGAHFAKMYFEQNNAADNFYLGYVADCIIDQVNGTGSPVISTGGKVWGVIRGMQNASDPGRVDPLGSNPVDYVPSAVLVNDSVLQGRLNGWSYTQNGPGLGSLAIKDSSSTAWAAVSGVEPPGGGADVNAVAYNFDTYTAVTNGAANVNLLTKYLLRCRNQGTTKFAVGFEGDLRLASSDQSGVNGGLGGNATINTPSGRFAMAAGAAAVTITAALVTAASKIIWSKQNNDATALDFKFVPGAGSFVVTAAALATAKITFDFFVVN